MVDDNPDLRQFTVDALATAGHEVESAPDGAAGWDMLQVNAYDLVITDNHMPRMTGMEMIAKIRSMHMSVLIIVATGTLPTKVIAHNPWLRPNALLERPFSARDLVTAVNIVLL